MTKFVIGDSICGGVPTRAKAIVLLTGTKHSAQVRNAGRQRSKG
jgi:hypothetical protein